MAYQMMKGKKGNNDGFPSIPGMIARYSALGLTNEQMAANPVWVDKTGNGHDIQLKNFSWKGMSGVGGYKFNFLSNEWIIDNNQVSKKYSYKIVINNKRNSVQLHNRINLGHIKITLKITGIEINKSTFRVYDNVGREHAQDYTKDGIYEIDYTANEGANIIYFYVFGGNMGQLENPITIEQLPLYPGFILGDGVDDEAVTKNNLDLEDTYTVYTPLILLKYGGVVCGKSSAKDYSLNTVISSKSIGFDSANAWSGSIPVDLYKFVLVVCKRNSKTMYVKDLITGKSNQRNSKEFVSNPGKYFIWRNTGGSWSQVAIAGQVICNGYFSTDEDDEKVLNYYKQEYPWLFFDQAWTVTGKTNEDEDRATIANITGNGNNLVLSNFGFAENSGYGLYQVNWNASPWSIGSSRFQGSISSDKIVLQGTKENTNLWFIECTKDGITNDCYVKVSGIAELHNQLPDANVVYSYFEGSVAKEVILSDDVVFLKGGITSVGNYLPRMGFSKMPLNTTLNTPIVIEQIPEYEGYLVTDGVDDRVQNSSFKLNKDWTLVGEWVFLNQKATNAGITKPFSFVVYNRTTGLSLFINTVTSGITIENVKSIKAICSDGRIYLDDWSEMLISKDQDITSSTSVLSIGFNGTAYTQMAFKNLGIYNNQILSKDDCIKAYNYLQTLKAK
jgi:hypothetical protein